MRRVLTRFFRRISRLFGIPEIQDRLDSTNHELSELSRNLDRLRGDTEIGLSHLDRRTADQARSTAASVTALERDLKTVATDLMSTLNRINEVATHAENRLQSLNVAIVEYVDEVLDLERAHAKNNRAEIERSLALIRASVDAVRREFQSNSQFQQTPTREYARHDSHSGAAEVADSFYVALEEHFRGSRNLVAERQSNYLPLLPNVISVDHPLIDLGCGRGEWLNVLRDARIPALGVDSNSVCVSECRGHGHEIHHGDLLSFIHDRPNSSVGTYTMFQVLEHLRFEDVIESLRQMRRSLVPGGLLIAEIPNAKNLRVSAGTFWIDPTHHRPLYPDFVEFLAHEIGFSQVRGIYLNDDSPKFDLSELSGDSLIAIRRILESIDTSQDFALLATA